MTLLLFLEPLEERTLLSGGTAGNVLPVPPDPTAVAIQYRPYPTGTEDRGGQLSSLSVDDDGPRHRDDDMENDRPTETDAANSFAIIVKAGLGEEGSRNNFFETREGRFSPPQAALANFVPADVAVLAPSPSFATTALKGADLAQDAIFPTDGMAEMATPGPLSDSVFLDGWQDGIPPPASELVPLSDKDLTIIAAYLVETPVKQGVAKDTPTMNSDRDLTDFIVGRENARSDVLPSHTPARSDEASMLRLAGEPRTIVPSQAMTVPPSIAPESSVADVNDDPPCGERSCPQEEQPGTVPVDGEG